MSDKKISVVLLGTEDTLKKALITNIFGKDLSEIPKTSALKKTQLYENDAYVIFCTPDLHTGSDDIKNLFAVNRNIDMSLLLVKDRVTEATVHNHFDTLEKNTKKCTEEFTVVLPPRSNPSDTYPYNCLTTEQVLKELGKLAEERGLVSTFERPAAHTKSAAAVDETNVIVKYWRTDDNRRSFRNAGTHTITPMVNIFLLGMSGTGKSASGNTILGKNHFPSKASSVPITRELHRVKTEIYGKHVHLIDTPDMFDDAINPAFKAKYVQRCRELCQSGPCVFVLVMQLSRFTDGERDIMKKLKEAFGRRVHKQTVILFTHGDDLKRGGMRLEDFLSSCQPDLKEIVEQCEYRCVVFENKTSDSPQVMKLMKEVENVLEKRQEQRVNRTQSHSHMTFPWS